MQTHILIPLAVVFLSVIGCVKPEEGGKDTPPNTPPQEKITIPSTVDVTPVAPPEGGDAKISFTAAAAWTASVISTKADSWVDVNPKSGNPGPAEIKITTTPNGTYVERNATIQIKCGGQTKDIVLTQKQVDNITVTTDKVELGVEGGSFTIELKSNIDFSYEIEGDWIKYVSTKAYSDKTLTFTAEPNEGVQKREGSITVKGGEFSETIKVYQSGEVPTMIITQNEYNLEADGGSIAVEVSSNVAVTMTIPEDAGWITENKSKSVSTSTFHLDVAANETYEARSAEITFSNEESGLSEKITVNQNGKTFVHVTSVTLDKNELTLIENEKATLVATVAPEDATDKSVEWSSDNPDVASVDDKGEVTAKTAGTATVTVTTRDGEKTAVCVVTVGWREVDFHHRSLIMWLASTAYSVCTWMAEAVKIVKEEHSDKIEAIAMHEKSSSLYFDGVNLMISRFQPDRIPMALLDCRKEVICEPQERIAANMLFEAAQETEDNYKAVTGISFNSAINGNTLDVDVSVYAKVAEDFKIAVVLLEDGIVANQDGVGPRYVHYDVPRLNLSSSMEGDPFTVSQAGTVVPLHFSGIIPDKCVKRNCRVLVYIQRKYGSQKVIQTRGYGEWYVDNCVSGRAGSSVPLVLDSGGSEYLGGNEDITSGDDINF